MGLGFGYDVPSYRIFVGSLRKAGFAGDVVLATSTLRGMRRGVAERGLSESFEKKEETKCSLFFLLSLSLEARVSRARIARIATQTRLVLLRVSKNERDSSLFSLSKRASFLSTTRVCFPHTRTHLDTATCVLSGCWRTRSSTRAGSRACRGDGGSCW